MSPGSLCPTQGIVFEATDDANTPLSLIPTNISGAKPSLTAIEKPGPLLKERGFMIQMTVTSSMHSDRGNMRPPRGFSVLPRGLSKLQIYLLMMMCTRGHMVGETLQVPWIAFPGFFHSKSLELCYYKIAGHGLHKPQVSCLRKGAMLLNLPTVYPSCQAPCLDTHLRFSLSTRDTLLAKAQFSGRTAPSYRTQRHGLECQAVAAPDVPLDKMQLTKLQSALAQGRKKISVSTLTLYGSHGRTRADTEVAGHQRKILRSDLHHAVLRELKWICR